MVSTKSLRDYRKSENVNILSEGEVLYYLANKFTRTRIGELVKFSGMFKKGEIISDSRGEGSQQKVTHPRRDVQEHPFRVGRIS